MAPTAALSPELQSHLKTAISPEDRQSLRSQLLPALLGSIADIARTLRNSQHVALAGTANAFGDDQLNVDVLAEDIIRDALAGCPSAVTASSEEEPVEKAVVHGSEASSERYTVAFDPLDGSSIIAPNWTVGTIVGIWDGDSALSQDPRQRQVAAILGVVGPRTTAVVAVRVSGAEPVCFEVGLADDGLAWDVIRPRVQLAAAPFKTRYFAPANLRAAGDDPRYMGLVTSYIQQGYTLRYSGGLVPDIVHALVKGHGVYVSPVTGTHKAKLRRLYELCPVALVVECAGGKAIDPASGEDVLARSIENCDERGGLVCGTGEEVELVKAKLFDVSTVWQ
ncbi:Sedoheptulose-1,7-bisphosphatase, chloroplastic [Paramyrothecium foliicola]|nr:Sedoheptulose-1,7-bisphosphatase, chloroplastic [Paramyrothecium foliicola]